MKRAQTLKFEALAKEFKILKEKLSRNGPFVEVENKNDFKRYNELVGLLFFGRPSNDL